MHRRDDTAFVQAWADKHGTLAGLPGRTYVVSGTIRLPEQPPRLPSGNRISGNTLYDTSNEGA